MVYSLVNVPTLVRDVARLPTADAIVGLLLRACALTTDDLTELDTLGYDDGDGARRRELLSVAARGEVAVSFAAVARGSAAMPPGPAWDAVESATIGDLEDLVRFLRHDVMTGAWSATGDLAVAVHPVALDVVTDGLVAAYAGVDDLGRQWRRWSARRSAIGVPAECALVIDAVRQLTPPAVAPVVPADWAPHVHDACWALHLTDRLSSATVAQLHALRSLLIATAGEPPGHALVATVVAAVHATMAADMLPDDVHRAMTQPLFRLLA